MTGVAVTTDALASPDCAGLAGAIAAAGAAESARTGRVCRLRDPATVAAFLRAVEQGCSQTAAAQRAGLSEGVVRRWVQLASGAPPASVYAQFKSAVEAVAEGRDAAARERARLTEARALASVQAVLVGNVTPQARPQPPPVAAPPEPTVHPYTIWSWYLRLERAAVCAVPLDAHVLRNEVAGDMLGWGVRTLPPRPALLLPRGVPFDRVQQMYLEWTRMTYQATPTERMLESLARRWYQEHQAPVEGVPRA